MATPEASAQAVTTELIGLQLRRWSDLAQPAIFIALAWSLAQITFVIWPAIDTLAQRALHVAFAVALAYALLSRGARSLPVRLVWLSLGILGFIAASYVAWNATYLTSMRIQGLDPVLTHEYILGFALIVLLFEAGRRVLGLGLALFTAVFVIYFFIGPYLPGELAHRYTGIERFIDAQYLSLQGIFGIPVGVSVSTVFYFILFAAVYDIYGGGRMIIDLAFAMTGRAVGGPAKAAVVSSGLLGSVSGSAVANVMSTGIFTIPLMKRAGYSPRFAGGVEAAASTGGQLVPPVMGAAAFIMADFLQVKYQTIVLAAVFPALVYYLALLFMVDLKARSEGLKPVTVAEGRPLLAVMKDRGHLLIPLVWLVYRVASGFPVENAALEGTIATVLIGSLRGITRRGPLAITEALIVAAERTVAVALPCALAGVVVAVIAFTGLGTKFTSMMIWMAAGQVAILLILTMFASLVLGTGMPTTSAYIMAAVLLAPALTTIGVVPLTAHFFVFYFAILSMVTPPVALAAYAAASVSRAPASSTGWTAFALSLPGFLIPFTAVIHPGLLLIGTPWDTLWGLANALMGFSCIGIALIGWLFRPLSWLWRGAFLILGVANLLPHLLMTIATASLLVLAIGWLLASARKESGRNGPEATQPIVRSDGP